MTEVSSTLPPVDGSASVEDFPPGTFSADLNLSLLELMSGLDPPTFTMVTPECPDFSLF